MKKIFTRVATILLLFSATLFAVEEDNVTATNNVNGSKSGETDVSANLKNTQNRQIISAKASGYDGKEATYNNSRAHTQDSSTQAKNINSDGKVFNSYTLTLSGDISTVEGSSGSTETYSVTRTKKGEFYIDPTEEIIAVGNSATFTAKRTSDEQPISVEWVISKKGGTQVQPATGKTSGISITSLSSLEPEEYTVTATEASGKTATATLKVFDISIIADGKNLMPTTENSRYAYIVATCTMPQLKAKLIPTSLLDDVEYSIAITYTRSGRKDSNTYSEKIKANSEWNINKKMGNDFRGGKAVLTYKYKDTTKNATFYIRGNNPSKSTATTYINSKTSLWYPQYVAIHESGSSSSTVMKQFNETGTLNSGNSDVKYTPNASSDGGFGIFQLTNPVPNAQQLWSWNANCDEGLSRLNSFQTYANNWMVSQRRQMADEGFSIPVPSRTYEKVIFAENTKYIIEHAVALKRYNGASGGNFCAWDNQNHQWKFNEFNLLNPPFNYVARICSEVK